MGLVYVCVLVCTGAVVILLCVCTGLALSRSWCSVYSQKGERGKVSLEVIWQCYRNFPFKQPWPLYQSKSSGDCQHSNVISPHSSVLPCSRCNWFDVVV